MAGRPPSVIRRQLVAEGFTLGDSPAPLASCQVGLRLTALSLICACSVRLAGLNASGATMMRDCSTSSLQASTARTPGAVRALRGLASGKPERKGVGGSTHGYGSAAAEANRRPQTRFCIRRLPSSSSTTPSERVAHAWPTGAWVSRASVAPSAASARRVVDACVAWSQCAVVLSVLACMYFSGLLSHESSACDVQTLDNYTHCSLIPASGRPTLVIQCLSPHSQRRHTHTLTAESRGQLAGDAAHAVALRHTAHLADVAECWPASRPQTLLSPWNTAMKAAVIMVRGRRPHKPIVVGVEQSHLPREKRRQCVRSAAGSGARAKCNNEVLTAVRAQRAWSCSQRGCPAAVNVDPLRRSFATASMKSSMRWLRVRNSGIFASYNGSAQPTAWLGRA